MSAERALLRSVNKLVWTGRLAQALSCLAGGVTLWCAIDDWLIGAPLRSAIFTTLAFVNGSNFVAIRMMQHQWLIARRTLRFIIEHRKGAP